jgi:hypothetical protein
MRTDPIVIFGSPRGGTSLVAGCFVNHGFWVGKTFGGKDGVGGGGYVNYENDALKKFIKQHFKLDAGTLMANPEKTDVFKFCQSIVPADTHWMWKGPTEYYPIFNHWFPDMTPVFVFRKESEAINAVVRRRGEGERNHAAGIIRSRYAIQEELVHTLPFSFAVEADKVVTGDYSQIKYVLDTYGIELNDKACGKHIQPEKWHV